MTGRSGGTRFKKALCRWCRAEVFWMPHVRTGKMAPIDWYPSPGGNVRCDFDAGVYEVLVGDERTMADATVLDPEHATANLYTNHHATCTSSQAEARRRTPQIPREVPKVGADLAAGPDGW